SSLGFLARNEPLQSRQRVVLGRRPGFVWPFAGGLAICIRPGQDLFDCQRTPQKPFLTHKQLGGNAALRLRTLTLTPPLPVSNTLATLDREKKAWGRLGMVFEAKKPLPTNIQRRLTSG